MPDQQVPRSARTEVGIQQVAAAMAQQTAMLRTVLERLDELVQLLTPKPNEGPTLDELLAGLVTLVSDQAVLLRRIDARTAVLVEPLLRADTLPIAGNVGVNGMGDRG